MLEFISHNIITTLKNALWHENVKILPSFTKRKNGRHYVTLQNL